MSQSAIKITTRDRNGANTGKKIAIDPQPHYVGLAVFDANAAHIGIGGGLTAAAHDLVRIYRCQSIRYLQL